MRKVIVVLLCLTGLIGTAQHEKKEQEPHHRRAMNDMNPQQLATLKTKKMVLALDLNAEQQERLQALNLKNAEFRKARHEERKAQREERKAKKEGDGAKRPTTDERFTMQNERLDRMIAHKTAMKEILSEEQYDQWEKMVQRKKRHRDGKEGGRKGDRNSRK